MEAAGGEDAGWRRAVLSNPRRSASAVSTRSFYYLSFFVLDCSMPIVSYYTVTQLARLRLGWIREGGDL
jgi:hypothetical protein